MVCLEGFEPLTFGVVVIKALGVRGVQSKGGCGQVKNHWMNLVRAGKHHFRKAKAV